ncbi:MAG: hypothetical protein JO099_25605 [Acidobacteriia bacterium]|nr:hypothetical protein [Terriglobia bacterium]
MVPSADKPLGRLTTLLAGLQAGMVAVLAMLAWMGLSAAWQQRSFWTSENLLATTFYGGRTLQGGFSTSTVSGLALYLLVYSTLGCLFALAAGGKLRKTTLLLAGIVIGLGWYYVSFRFLWKSVSPLVSLLHPVRPTIFGHLIYGVMVARFPHYFPGNGPTPGEPLVEKASVPSGVSEG